jgi:acyl carrier protein phosphodiesterase
MNHLAHFYLSGNDDDIKIGNFVADFINIEQVKNFSPTVQRGIRLHHAIDHFTDEHERVKTSWRRLYATHGKYAPVIVDIFYDFLLAQNWEIYQKNTSLRSYTEGVYTLLQKRQDELPPRLQSRMDMMINDDWLMRYTTLDGLEKTFERVGRMARFSGNFEVATQSLTNDLHLFQDDFKTFFPDLEKFVTEKSNFEK